MIGAEGDLADVVEKRQKILCIKHEALVPQDICSEEMKHTSYFPKEGLIQPQH